MTDPTAARKIYSWRTVKTADGKFTAKVTEMTPCAEMQPNGHYSITETVKSIAGFRTRAQARGRAVKWVRHYRSNMLNARFTRRHIG